ncbi:ABC transporter permease [Nocardioides guangzhouensis]|uniref:ABC transporter permease n=1 Tax=Nocardioides guangzhouensis TaxID=2497878 RepID=A0A4Q4Z5N0_9ACTN|nr:ABC transporter permease [Nocardioides guangzhouensis]RYP82316.1 ABC transporter permease [Nocardioides guangzhouensis]
MSLATTPTTAVDSAEPRPRRRGYGRYVLSKVAGAVGSLLFMLVVSFFLFRVLPGDPARTLGRGRFTNPEQIEEFNRTYGLNESLPRQFLTYLQNTFSGDLGISLKYRVPVSDLLLDRMWPTLLLVGTSTILATVIGVWLGIRGAWNRGSTFDKASTGASLTLYSMPEWWLGLLLIAVFAVGWGPIPGIFPTGGLHSTDVDPSSLAGVLDTAWHLTLPVITLTLAYLADYALIMRSSLLDELGEDYLTTARAKGLRDIVVRNRHAVPNALLPTTTVIALSMGFIVSGAITVETVFSIPGLGLLGVEALEVPDYWVLQGTFLVAAAGVILANLAANLLYGILDPRVRT